MLKNISNTLRQFTFARFFISGVTAAAVNISVLYSLTEFLGLWYVASSVVAFTVALVVSFTLQKWWAFRERSADGIPRQMVLYVALTVFNIVVNTALLYMLVERFSMYYIFAQILIGFVLAAESFIVYKYLIFKSNEKDEDESLYALYRWIISFKNSGKLMWWTFVLLPFRKWLLLWFRRSDEDVFEVQGMQFIVRNARLADKMVDVFMVLSCITHSQYRFPSKSVLGNKSPVIIDIGAHIGAFTLLASRAYPEGTVFSFEPSRQNLALLSRNVEKNRANNVTLFGQCVSGESGERTFYEDNYNSAMNGLYKKTTSGYSVMAISLSDMFDKLGIMECHFMKIDTEGAEYEILLEAPDDVLLRIKRIAIEYHLPPFYGLSKSAHNLLRLKSRLESAGFDIEVCPDNRMCGLLFASQ